MVNESPMTHPSARLVRFVQGAGLSFGSVFSFSALGGEYSYFRFTGIVCSGGPWAMDSDGSKEARASRGSGSGVRSMIDEMDCLVDRLGAGFGGVEVEVPISRGAEAEASSASRRERTGFSVLIVLGYGSSRGSSPSPSSYSDSSSPSCVSPSGSIPAASTGLSSVEPRLLADGGGSGAFGS